MTFWVLDLFCGAGGAAMGYHYAWPDAEIVGIDNVPQPDYPFTFIQGDATAPPVDLERFDFVHASPPCQSYSTMSNRHGSAQPDLIPVVRSMIVGSGVAGVIENVAGARPDMPDAVTLHGGMFGLETHRPRLFEPIGWFLMVFKARRCKSTVGIYGKPDGRQLFNDYRAWSSVDEGKRILGIDWTDDWHQIREAIPPAYTRYIGEQFTVWIADD